VETWQKKWDTTEKGKITKEYFPKVGERLHTKIHITPHFTTMVTGHGNIKSYPLGTVRPICRTGTPLPSKNPILYIFSTNLRTIFFKHAAHSPFFLSSKCHLFHNATFFGACIIRILHTECSKI
jgi:hypothetical protein